MKRSLSLAEGSEAALVVAGTCLIAGTYGLVRLAYGLFLPDIQASVAMGSAVAGYVSSGASAAYCVGAVVGALRADRPRLLVGAALATASAGSLGMATAPSMAMLVPSTVVASAGAGLASPGLVAVVGRNLAQPRRERAQATVNAGTGPGLVAAGLLALLLPEWRLGFTIAAVFTAAAGIGVLFLDRPDRSDGRRSTASTAGKTHPGTSAGAQRPGDEGSTERRWLAALLRPATAALLLGAASATVWTYGRAHLVSSGTSDSASILAWIAIGVGGTTTVLTADLLSALDARLAWLLTTGGAAVATAALGADSPLAVDVIACGLFGWGFVAATSALIAWVARLAPRRAASGTSVVFIALVVGQAAGSAAAGALSELVGLPSTFLLAAALTVVAASCGSHRESASAARAVPSSDTAGSGSR